MFKKFIFIGFGSIATSLIELFNIERKYLKIPFTIIEPNDIRHPELLLNREFIHVKHYMTHDNYKKLLVGLNKNTLVIDLSVNVDSLMVIKHCLDCGASYINTSIENYYFNDKIKTVNYDSIKADTIYHRELELEKLYKKYNKTNHPIVVNCGQNPGLISSYVKHAMDWYAKKHKIPFPDGDYAKLSNELGLSEILLCEYDSQTTNLKPKHQYFLNTWSCVGLQEEASDFTTLSLNNTDIESMTRIGIKLIKPNEGEVSNIRFLKDYGMNLKRSGICLDVDGKPFKYDGGMLIPHAEITSLSRFLQFDGNSPTIMYIYRVCDAAAKSLEYYKENNYKLLDTYYVLEQEDVNLEGFDSIGVWLKFKNGNSVWCGSVCSNEHAKKLGFKISTCTSIQVSGSVASFIEYIHNHRSIGLNECETLEYVEILEKAKKYLGNFFCVEI